MSEPTTNRPGGVRNVSASPGRRRHLTREGRIALSLAAVIIILFFLSGILAPGTLTLSHALEVGRQAVPLGLTAIGHTFVILTGGIDLSVGEIITMTNIIGTDLMRGRPEAALPVMGLLLGLGTLIGVLNGAVIAYTRVPPLVMTFGMSFIVRGFYLIYSGGTPKGSVSPLLRTIGAERIGIIPVSLLLYIAVILLFALITRRTVWGRSVFFIGNNPQAAHYSGIPVKARLLFAYGTSGLLATMAGFVLSGYIRIANFDIGGEAYTLNSVAAAVVGGNTFTGQGSVLGSVLGSFIITQVTSLMTSLGVGESGKLIMRGVVIVAMVAIYAAPAQWSFLMRRRQAPAGR
ncbi:MAG: ABC transporter permease [Firmicutes bacterium]|nr:ABC transporter permease [Bacillota bacterium]